jgi:hypothetical protein
VSLERVEGPYRREAEGFGLARRWHVVPLVPPRPVWFVPEVEPVEDPVSDTTIGEAVAIAVELTDLIEPPILTEYVRYFNQRPESSYTLDVDQAEVDRDAIREPYYGPSWFLVLRPEQAEAESVWLESKHVAFTFDAAQRCYAERKAADERVREARADRAARETGGG